VTSHAGREKCVRLVQYFLMFLIPFLKKKGAVYDSLVGQLGIMKGSMSLTRKLFRFGGYFPTIVNIIKRFKENQKSPVKMLYI
jgi:hypothetical protein